MVDVCVYVKATEVYGVGGVGREEEGRAGTIKKHTHTHTQNKSTEKKSCGEALCEKKRAKREKGFRKRKKGEKKEG